MKLLDKYLWKATLSGLLIAWLALVTLDVFFSFIDEARKTSELYTTGQALIYLVYTLPGRFYEFFPTAILIGTLLGLGNLAANSEFIAMRAAGFSIKQITYSVAKLGILLAVLLFAMGEWIVPNADLQARNFKAHLKNKNITMTGGSGLWLKDDDKLLNIGRMLSSNELSDISIYAFKPDFSGLAYLQTIKLARNSETGWILNDIHTSKFEEENIEKTVIMKETDAEFLNDEILEIATVDPEQLSTRSLEKIIQHQKDNQISSSRFELIFWKRFSTPLSAIVMLIIAMPLLFGSNRGGGAGQRIFWGILIGILFFLANRFINELGVVYGFSPILSAFVPSLLFLSLGLFALKRVG